MKKAIITGISGQDGAYLSAFLLKEGYRVFGLDCITSGPGLWRLEALGVRRKVKLENIDLTDSSALEKYIRQIKPDEIYNLAAQSSVKVSFSEPLFTAGINALGPLRILAILKKYSPNTAFFQASTAELFGNASKIPQDEKTVFAPESPYGIAKLFAHQMVVNYRKVHGLRACCGILYNHESPLRDIHFITRKVVNGAVRIKLGLQKKLVLGNIDAKRDWGYAGDFVRGMWLMLQEKSPKDYVLSTGESRSVRELVIAAFSELGIKLNWKGKGINEKGVNALTGETIVEISREFFRPVDLQILKGDSRKARKELGWKPEVTFKKMVAEMVAFELREGGNA